VCELVLGRDRGTEYVRKELTERYEQLRSDRLVRCRLDGSDRAEGDEFAAAYCANVRTALTREAAAELTAAASRLKSLFEKLPRGVRELVLLDWAEQRVLWTVKSELVPAYLRHCMHPLDD
jgi:hypothetical protein